MKIIQPYDVTDGMVIANNITGSTYTEWSSATSYAQTDKVKIDSVHREYECLIANTNKDPTTNPLDGSGNPYWLDLGATNDWAIFDNKTRSVSTNPLNITVSVKPNRLVNSIAILNISAGTLNVTAVSDSAGEVYNKDIVLRQYVSSFYDWFFSEITRIDNAVRIDLPAYNDMTVTITATSTSDVSIGEFVFGKLFEVGLTQYGTSLGIRDFSTKEFDTFGNPFVVERGFTNRIEYDVLMLSSRTNAVRRFLSKYRAKPLVYIGAETEEETITYGYYKSFNEVLQDYANTSMLLEVEELS